MKNLLFFINHIENSITKTLLYYFLLVAFTLSGFMIGMTANIIGNKGEVKIENVDGSVYGENISNLDSNNFSSTTKNTEDYKINENKIVNKSFIFGSSKGKYFYYKGCGGDSIAAKNLRYYKSEAEAIAIGKKLYKKCE